MYSLYVDGEFYAEATDLPTLYPYIYGLTEHSEIEIRGLSFDDMFAIAKGVKGE